MPASDFRLDVKMVEIPVTVTDILEHPVLGLQKADFRLFEDGTEQQVVTFAIQEVEDSVRLADFLRGKWQPTETILA